MLYNSNNWIYNESHYTKFPSICHRFDYIHKLIDWTSINEFKSLLGHDPVFWLVIVVMCLGAVLWLADIQMSLCYDDDDADVLFSGWKLWSNYNVGAVGMVAELERTREELQSVRETREK